MDFQPTELPTCRDGGPSSSEMLRDMAVWTGKFTRSPGAVAFADYNHWHDAVAKFVTSSLLSEDEGPGMTMAMPSLEDIKTLLQRRGGGVQGAGNWDLVHTGLALQGLKAHYDLRLVQAQHQWEALLLSPDLIMEVQRVLAGEEFGCLLRTSAVTSPGDGNNQGYQHPDPSLIPGMLQALCDLFNALLRGVADADGASGAAIADLYKLAALLFLQVEAVKPFAVGNSRMARLLACFVLWALTPFPVTLICDGSVGSRRALQQGLQASWSQVCPDTFLGLLPPCDLSASLIEAGWLAWRDFIGRYQRSIAVRAEPVGGDMAAVSCSSQKPKGLSEVDELSWLLGTSLSL